MRPRTLPLTRPGGFLYPESDGRPTGETDEHRDILLYLVAALKLWFRNAKDVYVSGNIIGFGGSPYPCAML